MKITKIDLDKDCMVFSDLEDCIMCHLWQNSEATASQIYKKIKRKDIASTTVVVTLDRLYKKGLVSRRIEKGRGGLHYVYSPKFSKEDLGKDISRVFAERVIRVFGPGVASYFSKEALSKIRQSNGHSKR